MPAQSQEFAALRSRITELRARMLPSRFSPTGDYTLAQRERARGFRLLVHAELETFLERLCERYAAHHAAEWEAIAAAAGNKPQVVLHGRVIDVTKTEALMVAVKGSATTSVSRNHGLKQDHLRNLFGPLGIDVQAHFPTLVANLSSYGTQRGQYAHAGGVVTLVDPKTELEAVRNLLPDLKRLDHLLGG